MREIAIANMSELVHNGVYSENVLGCALERFLGEVHTIPTKVGATSPGYSGGDKYLKVLGVQLDDIGLTTDLLGKTSVSIKMPKKFQGVGTASAVRCLSKYMTDNEIEGKQLLIDRLVNIETYREMLTPIRTRSRCTCVCKQETTGEKRVVESTIKSMKWMVDSETSEMNCILLTDILDGQLGARGKYKITEYGHMIALPDTSRIGTMKIKAAKTSEIIDMTMMGYIKPIQIMNNDYGLAIDNCFVYRVTNGDVVTPVGYWGMIGKLEEVMLTDNENNSEVAKVLKSYIDKISKHRKYIAPYNCVGANIIRI